MTADSGMLPIEPLAKRPGVVVGASGLNATVSSASGLILGLLFLRFLGGSILLSDSDRMGRTDSWTVLNLRGDLTSTGGAPFGCGLDARVGAALVLGCRQPSIESWCWDILPSRFASVELKIPPSKFLSVPKCISGCGTDLVLLV